VLLAEPNKGGLGKGGCGKRGIGGRIIIGAVAEAGTLAAFISLRLRAPAS
jgi:hypothetical protein